MSTFYYVPQYFTTQLSVAGGIDDSQTTGIVLQSITGVDETKPGIIAISWSNPIDTTKVEYITYTSINSSTKELQGVTRGGEGYSAKSHVNGATVAWPLSKSHINNIPDSTTTFINKTLTSPLFQGTVDGWISANETWTYASATTITVPSGATAKYQKGDKIKLTQSSTVKYFYVVGVTNTVLTITGGSDYTLANATISDNYYSHQENPLGFPQLFNCAAPTWTVANIDNGSGGQPTAGTSIFSITGSVLELSVKTAATDATKAGSGVIIGFATPATLPNSSEPNFVTVGVCSCGGVDVLGLVQTSGTGSFRLFLISSVTDNTSIPTTNFKIRYNF